MGTHDIEKIPQQIRLRTRPENAVEVNANIDFDNKWTINDVGQFQDLQRLRNKTAAKPTGYHGNR